MSEVRSPWCRLLRCVLIRVDIDALLPENVVERGHCTQQRVNLRFACLDTTFEPFDPTQQARPLLRESFENLNSPTANFPWHITKKRPTGRSSSSAARPPGLKG
ncbi:hypothetical protein [Ralstonia pseudosolanacearum]|uniref:hypothetical protein n=1 Tax=Ralstonia pseudosolanacearum TaxID=1310165 RepID=UPI001E4082C2|nr:hypothetical protein [Ralstonia pseudosolanacearum]